MMRAVGSWGALFVAVAGLALSAASGQSQSPSGKPPLSFTAGQAASGQQVFEGSCQACHGTDLGGGPGGPPLTGSSFRAHWRAEAGDALFAFIRDKMPPGGGRSLDDASYANVTARILQANGTKPGPVALPTDPAKLAQFSISNAFPADPPIAVELKASLRPTPNQPDSFAKAAFAERAARLAKLSPVTDAMLRNPPAGEWLNWRNTQDAQGYSRLTQIDRSTAPRLQLAWSWELTMSPNEITPIVHDGVLFIASGGRLQAIDAASGDLLWQYIHPVVGKVMALRGIAIYGEMVYFGVGGNLIALDVHDGSLAWEKPIAAPDDGIVATSGPFAAKGKIFQGMSFCAVPYPGGCFLVALDAKTGKEAWRFHTIARPGQPGGDSWNGATLDQRVGGSIWTPPSYDPDLDLLYVGTGQTYHTAMLLEGTTGKPGSTDALYTNSTVALRPDTGEIVWHYQHVARDVWDLDWAFERTLTDMKINGKMRRTLTTAGKLAIFDTLDAATGEYLFSHDMGLQNLISAIDPKTGIKTIDPKFKPEPNVEKSICPSGLGGRNWPATAYDPHSGVLFVPLNESCMKFMWSPGTNFDITIYPRARPDSEGMVGRIQAMDLATGKILWTRRERAPHSSAILATAGGLIFEGNRDRWFRASDAQTGKIVWQVRLNGVPSSYPITYSVDGVQYVAVTTGGGASLDASMGGLAQEIPTPSAGTTLWVFKLPAK